MDIIETELPGVLILEPRAFADERGYFMETWQQQRYAEAGIAGDFVQDNLVRSGKGVLRGLHAQHPHAQGKLVQALKGEVFDVAVDIRQGSATFGEWTGVLLSEDNHRQLWIPAGFAHGYVVLSEDSLFSYKCTDYWNGQTEFSIIWNDPEIAVDWPESDVLLSPKDANAPLLKDIPASRLPPCA
ncbi:MAG: dTDP-4-dehydrorhamnose 3,5-epimerase [gamma proteobacterium symbiont of Bathyaustriella thionipta]|nr:dTDP-4-dehydrorhamnose 3,5-epimerase [gamma proteobacterium symbiont of Bathyaustriella thionipta]